MDSWCNFEIDCFLAGVGVDGDTPMAKARWFKAQIQPEGVGESRPQQCGVESEESGSRVRTGTPAPESKPRGLVGPTTTRGAGGTLISRATETGDSRERPAQVSQAHFEVGRLTTADLFYGHSSTRHGSNTPEVAGRNRRGGVGSYPSAVSGSGGSGSDWSADITASRRTASGSPTRTPGRGLVAHSIAALQRAYRGL